MLVNDDYCEDFLCHHNIGRVFTREGRGGKFGEKLNIYVYRAQVDAIHFFKRVCNMFNYVIEGGEEDFQFW